MPFTIIKGTFHVVGCSPDGDSIQFRAERPASFGRLAGPPVKINRGGCTQLRLEAIDATERHYGGFHQPAPWAEQAAAFTLNAAGISGVVWDERQGTVAQAADGTPGHIVSRAIEKNRRPVAFVFAGDCPEADGAEIVLTPERAEGSINYQLVAAGLAYPTFYEMLFFDLREAFTRAVRAAREAQSGLWRDDRSGGVDVSSLESITTQYTILPKLFRRLCDHLAAGGAVPEFREHLARRAEGVYVLSRGQCTHYDTVVEVSGSTVRLTVPPEDLVFAGE